MSDASPELEKPEPIWRAIIGECVIAAYDFKALRKPSDKSTDNPSVILMFPVSQIFK